MGRKHVAKLIQYQSFLVRIAKVRHELRVVTDVW